MLNSIREGMGNTIAGSLLELFWGPKLENRAENKDRNGAPEVNKVCNNDEKRTSKNL